MADSNSNNLIARSVETSVAGLISLVLSKEEYQKLLSWANVRSDKDSTVKSVILPNPKLVDSALLDDIKTYASHSGTSDEPFEHSTPRIVRSNTRFFLKAYLLILGVQSGRVLYKDRGVWRTLVGLSVWYKNGAKVAFVLAGISLTYKLVFRLLSLLKNYASFVLNLVDGEQKSNLSKIITESKTTLALASGAVSGSLFYYFPVDGARDIIAVYTAVRSLEILYNYLDERGVFRGKPKILGSWTLYPFAFAELFHSYFFHPDVNLSSVNRIITLSWSSFFPTIPLLSKSGSWPATEDFTSSIAQLARHGYPEFKAPAIFPNSELPTYLTAVEPVLVKAHPQIQTTIAALTHPFEPNLARAYSRIVSRKFKSVGKYVLGFYVLRALLSNKKDANGEPVSQTESIFMAVINSIKLTTFIVLSTTTAHLGLELSEKILGSAGAPEYRFKMIGFLAGLWAIVDKTNGHGRYMFAVRAAIISLWRTLVKNKRVRSIKNGDVYVFVASFSIIMAVFENSPACVTSPFLRKILFWVKNDDFRDPVASVCV